MTSSVIPLRFGADNSVPDATLSSNPITIGGTDLDWLKTERASQQVAFSEGSAQISITGVLPTVRVGDYMALPNTNLIGTATAKLELFADDQAGSGSPDLLNMDPEPFAEQTPVGVFEAGIDSVGVPKPIDNPDVYVKWFDAPVLFQSFRLTIDPQQGNGTRDGTTGYRFRMLLIGKKLQMERDFAYGHEISFVTDPELVQAATGRRFPARAQRKQREFSLAFGLMSDADRIKLWQLEVEAALENRPVFVSAFPGETGWRLANYSFLARFNSALVHREAFDGVHQSALTLFEV